MKRFLVFIILILIALLFILNWRQRKAIVICAKEKTQEVQCSAKEKYETGKQWVKDKAPVDRV
ncbi:MAG: hypothetical protein S4CHLAM6_04160 [Chlamydiae bacterium]|nr:hypothetical protein [Chlamydiota bacterium]